MRHIRQSALAISSSSGYMPVLVFRPGFSIHPRMTGISAIPALPLLLKGSFSMTISLNFN
jgi:hypothetical protein